MLVSKLVCRVHLRLCPAVKSSFVAAQLAVKLLQNDPARHDVHRIAGSNVSMANDVNLQARVTSAGTAQSAVRGCQRAAYGTNAINECWLLYNVKHKHNY